MKRCKQHVMTSLAIVILLLSACNVKAQEIIADTSLTEVSASDESDSQLEEPSNEESEVTNIEGIERSDNLNESEIYYQYIQDILVPQYGIASLNAEVIFHKTFRNWLQPEGIVSAYINDLDLDGVSELLLLYIKDMGEGEETGTEGSRVYWLYANVYTMRNDVPTKIDETPIIINDEVSGRENKILFYTNTHIEETLYISTITLDGSRYVIFESDYYGHTFSDGTCRNYWALKLEDGKLKHAFSFIQTDGGSDAFEYTGFEYEYGQEISSELLYSRYEEYNGGAKGTYDDFHTAAKSFFERHGLSIDTSKGFTANTIDSLNGFGNSILDDNSLDDRILSYCIRCRSEDRDNEKYTYALESIDHTDLRSHVNVEAQTVAKPQTEESREPETEAVVVTDGYTWEHDGNGWMLKNPEGEYLHSQWYQSPEGKWYYFNSMFYMLADTLMYDGYLLGADGARIPCNPEKAGKLYLEYLEIITIDAFDGLDGSTYTARYFIEDFNKDGVKDLLLFGKIDEYGTGGGYNTEGLYTIRDGQIICVDETTHLIRTSYKGDNLLFRYEDHYIILCGEGRYDSYLYSIGSDMKFIQELYFTDWHEAEDTVYENLEHIYAGIEDFEEIEWGMQIELTELENKFHTNSRWWH